MFTAIGFETNHQGFGALEVETDEKKNIEDLLAEAFGVEFETFVLMKNGSDAPEVVAHWQA